MERRVGRRASKAAVRQLDESDCGAACLAWAIRYLGGEESIERLRALSGTAADGTTLLGLKMAAEQVGLSASAYSAGPADLERLELPSILHILVEGHRSHFVVCFGGERDLLIGDPATGLSRRSSEEVAAMWKSRALLHLRPAAGFVTRTHRRHARRRWLADLVRADLRPLLLSVALGAVVSVFGLATAMFSKELLDDILPGRDVSKLVVGIALLLLVLLAQVLLSVSRQVLLLRQARSFNVRMTARFLRDLLHLPYGFFSTRKTGDLIARLNDAERLQEVVTHVLGATVINLFMVVVGLAYIGMQVWPIALLVGASVALYVVLAYRFHAPIVERQRSLMTAHAVNKSGYVEAIQGIETIKTFSAETLFTSLMRDTYSRLQDEAFRLGMVAIAFGAGLEVIGTATFVGALGWSSVRVFNGSLGTGALVAVLQMLGMVVPAARGLAASNVDFQEAAVAFDRMFQLTSLDPEYDPDRDHHRSRISKLRRVQVDQVTFRFPGRPALLEDASMECARGELVLLVGRTGSGKSSLLRILQRLLIPESGRVLLNGCESDDVSLMAWRRLVGVVPQHIQIFSGSLLDNILLGRDIRPEDAVRMCIELGLAPYFAGLPSGYATLIGEGGVAISGGQRQLVGLARALVQTPEVLLLDEPTSSMDGETADFVMDLVDVFRRSRLAVVASHAPPFRARADRIYRISDGRVESEFGRPWSPRREASASAMPESVPPAPDV